MALKRLGGEGWMPLERDIRGQAAAPEQQRFLLHPGRLGNPPGEGRRKPAAPDFPARHGVFGRAVKRRVIHCNGSGVSRRNRAAKASLPGSLFAPRAPFRQDGKERVPLEIAAIGCLRPLVASRSREKCSRKSGGFC